MIEKMYLVVMYNCHCSKQRNAFYRICRGRYTGGGEGVAKSIRSVLRGKAEEDIRKNQVLNQNLIHLRNTFRKE